MTRLSVILPVHNAEPFLALALGSLLEQTQRDFRVIAIDDGSTDASASLLWAAADIDPRVTVISRGNRGLIATLNEGLALADSDMVARMDADDIAYPDRFGAQLGVFAARPDLGLLGTGFCTLFTPTRIAPPAVPVLTKAGERAVLGRFCTSLRHPTVMVRRSSLGAGSLHYDPDYPHAEDFDLFRRLALTTAIAETETPHLAYRVHAGSISATRVMQMADTHLRILEENLLRHYPQAAGTGVVRIALQPDADTVEAAAELIRRLDALAPQQPDHERDGFDIGVNNTVHFLFALLCRSGAFGLAHRFIARADRQGSIRRRERAVLRTPLAPAGMAMSDWLVDRKRWQSSRLLAEAVPGFAAIRRAAQRIEQAAANPMRARHAG